jgi:ABC-2 type transport system permease protein
LKMPEKNAVERAAHVFGLYGIYLKMYFRTLVEYRADTWVAIFAGLLTQVSSLVFLGAVFEGIPKLAGWSFFELLFLFSLAATGKALNQVFLDMPFSLNGHIRRGTLDVLLVKPVGLLFQAIGTSQEINGMGAALTGVIIMYYAASHMEVIWTLPKITYIIVALLSSMVIQFAVLLAVAVSSFWVVEIRSVIYPIVWLYDFTRYPLDIFSPVIRTLLTYILPFALGSFYPAAYLLRPGAYTWAGWGVPTAACMLMFLSYRFWLLGLKHYTSASG